jgi:hypothetical protein
MKRHSLTHDPHASAPTPHYPGLERLICLALADPHFAAQLLADPASAVERASAPLRLSQTELAFVKMVKGAVDVPNFAERLYVHIQDAQQKDINF